MNKTARRWFGYFLVGATITLVYGGTRAESPRAYTHESLTAAVNNNKAAAQNQGRSGCSGGGSSSTSGSPPSPSSADSAASEANSPLDSPAMSAP